MSGLGMPLPSGQSPMPFASQDSNTAGNSNHSGDGLLIPDPSPEKPVTTARTPTERKRKRKTATQNQPNAAGTPANPNLMSTAPIGIEIRICTTCNIFCEVFLKKLVKSFFECCKEIQSEV